MDTIYASELVRNDRVVLRHDELPYLVDSVSNMGTGAVRVRYSSGDVAEYAAGTQLTVIG